MLKLDVRRPPGPWQVPHVWIGAPGVVLSAALALNAPPLSCMCCFAVGSTWHAEHAAVPAVIATSPAGVEQSGPASIVVASAMVESGG